MRGPNSGTGRGSCPSGGGGQSLVEHIERHRPRLLVSVPGLLVRETLMSHTHEGPGPTGDELHGHDRLHAPGSDRRDPGHLDQTAGLEFDPGQEEGDEEDDLSLEDAIRNNGEVLAALFSANLWLNSHLPTWRGLKRW